MYNFNVLFKSMILLLTYVLFCIIFLWLFGRFRCNSFHFFREMPASSSPYIKSLSVCSLLHLIFWLSRLKLFSLVSFSSGFLYIVCDLIVVITFIHYQIFIRIIKCWDHAYCIHYLWAVHHYLRKYSV